MLRAWLPTSAAHSPSSFVSASEGSARAPTRPRSQTHDAGYSPYAKASPSSAASRGHTAFRPARRLQLLHLVLPGTQKEQEKMERWKFQG